MAGGTQTLHQCSPFQFLCRPHCYKIVVAVIIVFLLMEYGANVIVYKGKMQKSVPPGFSWVSSLALHKVIGLGQAEQGSETLPESVIAFSDHNSTSLSDKMHNNTEPIPPNGTVITMKEASQNASLCPLVPPKLVGPLKVLTSAPSFEELEKLFPDLEPGGHYHPKECKARNKVAIIIPYRDRELHLRIFLHNLHPMLRRQQLDYGIYIVEEAGKTKFNRAMLMNIGYAEALKLYDYDCFIFHDVDLIPEDDRNLYTCPEQPRHMSVAIDVMGYKLPYKDIFGGVSALTKNHFKKVNGFSNEFWGWGGEDDDMSNRIRYHGLHIIRYPPSIARYKMLKHKKDEPNPERYNKLYRGRLRFARDGVNSLKYKRLDLVLKKLYTWILVEIKPK